MEKLRLDENHVPQVDGCFSADGQKTRVNENPCPRGMYPPGLQEGRASGDLDGKLDWMRTMSHRWMPPLWRWTEN
jgi:hypothetical protein